MTPELTPERLVAATGCLLDDAQRIAKPLADVMAQYAVTTPLRQAAFLAQTAHESRRYQRLVENLRYRDPERLMQVFGPTRFPRYETALGYVDQPEKLANYVYADRLGNGPESSGDGWAFRGRGLIQLTGRDAYTDFGIDIGEPIVAHPDLVAQPAYACLSAGWYWQRNGLNALADAGQIDRITRRINGPAMAGAEERARLYHRALRALTQEQHHA